MEKFVDYTKSLFASIALIALVGLSVAGINYLNPVTTDKALTQISAVAGLQDTKVEKGDVKFKYGSSNFNVSSKTLSFEVKPGQTNVVVGNITLTNSSNGSVYDLLSAQFEPNLKKLLRIEILDGNNTILLADFNKEFPNQKIALDKNSDRTFNVKYILAQPVNYTSTITLTLQ
jgi:hypothetical protein